MFSSLQEPLATRDRIITWFFTPMHKVGYLRATKDTFASNLLRTWDSGTIEISASVGTTHLCGKGFTTAIDVEPIDTDR